MPKEKQEEQTEEIPLKLISMIIKDFKRIYLVEMLFKDGVTVIAGANGQGKSSALDALESALRGGKASPEVPIRTGATSSCTVVDLNRIVVTERHTAKSRVLEVKAKDGSILKRPQAVLDELLDRNTIDPLAFMRASDKERIAIIQQLDPTLNFDDLDGEHDEIYAKRTVDKRALAEQRARLGALAIFPAETPDKEVSVSELTREFEAASARIAENEKKREALALAVSGYKAISEEIKALQAKATALREEASAKSEEGKALQIEVSALEDPDLDEIRDRLDGVEKTNVNVRLKKERGQVNSDIDEIEGRVETASGRINEIQEEKRVALSKATLPVEGLEFDSTTVLLDGVPFDQGSGAELLIASTTLAFALSPKLKLAVIRDGSRLDDKSMAIITKAVNDQGGQLLIERVDSGGDVGIVIEDGRNKAEPENSDDD